MDIKHGGNPRITLVIGLGNGGPEYADTYHNIGASLVSDMIRERNAPLLYSGKYISIYKSEEIFLGVPSCFMNESGRAVREALQKRAIHGSELLIIHDDSDLQIGTFKLSYGRGSAGHRGVESIFTALKTREFWRARVGIRPVRAGKPTREKAALFVLKRIHPLQKKKFQGVRRELEVTAKLIENAAEPSG